MLLDIVLGFSFFSFHADLKKKGPLIFLIFHHGGLIHHGRLNLCAFSSLRDITILMVCFSKSAVKRIFFCFYVDWGGNGTRVLGIFSPLVFNKFPYLRLF
jgi:hypothetical protein